MPLYLQTLLTVLDNAIEGLKVAVKADWGTPLEAVARKAGAAVAYTYTAGYVTGEFVHKTSASLGALAKRYLSR